MPRLMIDGLAASGSFSAANAAKYNNEKSGLEATNVQSAIDELVIEKQNSEDSNLSTESKEIVGAINELNKNIADVERDKQDATDVNLTTDDKTVVGAINALNSSLTQKQNKTDASLTTESKEIVGAINALNNSLINKVSKTGDTLTGTLTVTNGSQAVKLFADGEGGTLELIQPTNNRAVHHDMFSGNARTYLYQQDPWAYKNDLIIKDDQIYTASDFVNGNGVSLNGLNTTVSLKQDASTAITTSNIGSQTVAVAKSCTGNAATATSAAKCTGNAATATSASKCTGNSATATTAAKLGRNGSTSTPMTFNWSGQSGQPAWLWGGSDGTNMYVYNPSNFSVYASTTTSWWYGAVHVHSTSIYNISGGTGAGMFSNDQINSWIIGSGASESNTAVFVSNGDGNTMSAHTEGATYVSGWWYVTLSAAHGGAARINWMILRWN